MTDPRWRGIARHGSVYRASVSRGRGVPPLRKSFPLDTPVEAMQRWRADMQAHWKRRRTTAGTFAADAKRYLKAKAAAPDLKNLTRAVEFWILEFGTRRRDEIRPVEIASVRDRLLTAPRSSWNKPGEAPPLSPHTVNLRLRVLSNLYRTLDGKQAYNPVRDVPEANEPQPAPRLLDYQTIRAILEQMPASLTKTRVAVLAYTGLPASLVMRLEPSDVDLEAKTMRVPPRRKGHGTRGATLPLLPQAVEAFKELAALEGFGKFSTSSLHKSWTLAIRKLKVSARPYDLRHAFALTVYDATGDLELVMALLRHRDIRTSERYRQAILERVWQRKAQSLGSHFGIT